MVGTVLSLLYDEMVRIWCYRWTAIITAVVLFVAGAAYIVRMPDNYDAWAQIYVPRQTSLSAAAANVSLGAEYGGTYVVQKTLLNDQNLGKVAEQLNPTLSRLSPAARQAAILSLRNKIEVVPDGGDGFTEFHYTTTSPVKAYRVVQLLLAQFVSSTQDRAQRDFSQADVFLDSQIAIYQRKLNESQQKITAFHARYGDSAALATDTSEEADAANDVENARAIYSAALARDGGGSPAQGQIAALEDRIAALRLQYTDQYPDVIAARQQLAQLQQRAAAPARSGGNSAVAAARGQLAAAQARLRRARFRPTLPPQIAAQEADLKRTDDMLRNAYQELLARREAAQMSLAVYGANNSAKFQVTNQPTIPATPSGPNRLLLLGLAVLAAIAGGIGAAYLRGAITGVFVAPRELEEAFQLPVIGTISWEQTWHTGEVVQSSRNVAVFVTFGVIVLVATVLVSVSTSPWLQATFHQYSTTLFQGFVK
jgi:polysaccharide chain length determinant protein (PEP-CTERM system associated)